MPIFLSLRRINPVALYCIKYSPDPHPVIMVRRKGSAFGSGSSARRRESVVSVSGPVPP